MADELRPYNGHIVRMIRPLLPEHVVIQACHIASVKGSLPVEEARFVATAVRKRRQEFLAGRVCARAALEDLGVAAPVIPVRHDRTPVWPQAVVGSITHSDHYCAAAVAFSRMTASIGIDLEEVARFEGAMLPRICTEREIAALTVLPVEQQVAGTIFFSAKESFFKCQYPLTRIWLSFIDVEIDLFPTAGERVFGEFRVALPSLVKDLDLNAVLTGRFAVRSGVVATAMTLAC